MLALGGFAILSLAQVQLLLENCIYFDVYRYKIMIRLGVRGKEGLKESVTIIKGLKKNLLSELN